MYIVAPWHLDRTNAEQLFQLFSVQTIVAVEIIFVEQVLQEFEALETELNTARGRNFET